MKKRAIAFITGSIVIAPALLFARWGNSCWSDGPFPGRGGWFGYHFFGGGIFMFLGTLVLAGITAYLGYNWFKVKKSVDIKSGNPLEILKMRYAKGEISKEEFNRMKDDVA